MMRAGALDREILIEKKSVSQDTTYGTDLISWVPLSTVSGQPERYRASVMDVPPSRAEAVAEGLRVARNQTRIRIRWRSDVDSAMRITLFGDVNIVYQIVGGPAEVEGRKDLIEMVCERYSS